MPFLPSTSFRCIFVILSLRSFVQGSCDYPFHPLKNTTYPTEFIYCDPADASQPSRCPVQSTCEDLWLGMFVCCGYTKNQGTRRPFVSRSRTTASDSGSTVDLSRNRKVFRQLFHDVRQAAFSRLSVTNASNAKNETLLPFISPGIFPVNSTFTTLWSNHSEAAEKQSESGTMLNGTGVTTHSSDGTKLTSKVLDSEFIQPKEFTTKSSTFNSSTVPFLSTIIKQPFATTEKSKTAEYSNVTVTKNALEVFTTARPEKTSSDGSATKMTYATTRLLSSSALTAGNLLIQTNTTYDEAHRLSTRAAVFGESNEEESLMKELMKNFSVKTAQKSLNSAPPQVYVLQEGKSENINAFNYKLPSSITLISDNGKTVIVDTGLPTDYETLGMFLNELTRYGTDPESIDVVITTHGHPDHFGHLNLFPMAVQIFGRLVYVGHTFAVSDLESNEIAKLSDHLTVYRTPGHTAEDLTVVVTNVTHLGTVAVVGDLFLEKSDIYQPDIWMSQSWNVTLQHDYRRLIICIADYIIPGHGPMFAVEENMKHLFEC